MKINESKSIQVCGNLVAFKWLKPRNSIFTLPENFNDLGPMAGEKDGLRAGRFHVGEVIAVGPKVDSLKPGQLFIVHEYAIKNYRGTWQEDEVHFIEEEFIPATIDKLPESFLDLRGKLSDAYLEAKRTEGMTPEEVQSYKTAI